MTDDHGETTGKSELQFRDPKRDRAYRPVGAEPQDKGFLRAWTGANGNKAETIRKVEATYGTCCESHASPKPIQQLSRRRRDAPQPRRAGRAMHAGLSQP